MVKLEAPDNLPWLVAMHFGVIFHFEVKVDSIVKVNNVGPEKKWSAYTAEMRKITDTENRQRFPDGNWEVPFWAMQDFYNCLTEVTKEKGWQKLYCLKRAVPGKDDETKAEVSFSTDEVAWKD